MYCVYLNRQIILGNHTNALIQKFSNSNISVEKRLRIRTVKISRLNKITILSKNKK